MAIAWPGGWLNREALAAAARALGVGIVEHEARGEIVLAPVHGRSDEVEHRGAIDIENAARGFDLLVERLFIAHVIDRVSETRTAALGGRQLDPDRACGRAGHQVGDALLGGRGEDDGGGSGPTGLNVHAILQWPFVLSEVEGR